ncbi:MAG: methyltransferase [Methanotrichaceae archaeon]|nr:methyltransferase [Methanotrichaceae archaeon]
MDCPCCGKGGVRTAEEVIAGLDRLYMACPDCAPDPGLDKGAPLSKLRGSEEERCHGCGRRHIDSIMLNALDILVEEGVRDESDTLRSVGTPLVEIGFVLPYPPRLGPKELLIASDEINRSAALHLIEAIPELKGVIGGRGLPGVYDIGQGGRSLDLLAGCDLRGDIASSLFGDLLIYKNQAHIHIEFPRPGSPKVRIVEEVMLGGRAREVIDGLCGPGTLGLVAALAGAERVVFNDAWLYAIEDVMLNLWANREALGISEIERIVKPSKAIGSDPVLVGRASGRCEIEVYHGDLERLFFRAQPGDVCLIDPFPNAPIERLKAASRCCKRVVIV